MFNKTWGNTLSASRANPYWTPPATSFSSPCQHRRSLPPLYFMSSRVNLSCISIEKTTLIFLHSQYFLNLRHRWKVKDEVPPELWLIFPILTLFPNQTFCFIVNVYFDPLLVFSLRYFSYTFNEYYLLYCILCSN